MKRFVFLLGPIVAQGMFASPYILISYGGSIRCNTLRQLYPPHMHLVDPPAPNMTLCRLFSGLVPILERVIGGNEQTTSPHGKQ